jgi:hypothetical protein
VTLRSALLALTLGSVTLWSARVAATGTRPGQPAGEPWKTWEARLAQRFDYARVTFSGAGRPMLAGGRGACPKGPFQRPGLRAMVHSPDRQIFGEITISIYQLEAGGDGLENLRRSLRARPDAGAGAGAPSVDADGHCADVGNAAVSFIQSGDFWLEVLGSCADGALYRYEVGEVLGLVRQTEGARAPSVFAFTRCGEGTPKIVAVDDFLSGLTKKATYGGRPFPEARREARARLAPPPAAAP